MSRASLCEFISSVLARKRLRFGDLRRLQRDVLPSGITSREEAEALLALDRAIPRADVDWPGYLRTAAKDFVVSNGRPPGCVDAEVAGWLVGQLSGLPPRTGLAIAREVVLEAEAADEALVAFAEGARPKPKVVASEVAGSSLEADRVCAVPAFVGPVREPAGVAEAG